MQDLERLLMALLGVVPTIFRTIAVRQIGHTWWGQLNRSCAIGDQQTSLKRKLIIILITTQLTVVIGGIWATNSNPTNEIIFLNGLRQRRLFSLASSYCQQRLATSNLTDQNRILLIAELSRCYAERALHSEPTKRETDWELATTVIDDWNHQYEDDSRYLVARVQQALVWLARGEWTRQATENNSIENRNWDETRTALRQAITQLETLAIDVVQDMRKSHNDPNRLSSQELRSLQTNIRFQLARAYRNRALTYAPESADRISDITLSLQQLQPLTQLSLTQDIVWRSRLTEIICYRLLGHLQQANQLATSLLSATDNTQHQLLIQAEQIRLALAADNLPLALQLSKSATDTTRPADWDYAILEMLMVAWQVAIDNQTQTAMWQKRIAVSLESLARDHGAAWRNRGGALVASVAHQGTHSDHLDLMIQTAQTLYVNHEWEQAIKTFCQAAEQANTIGDLEGAFRIALTAARIEHDHGELSSAIRLWRKTSIRYPKHPESPQAHWLAISGAASQAATQDAANVKQYTALLQEHLVHWPLTDTGNKVRWWLGQLYEHQDNIVGALNLYREIPADTDLANKALLALGRCWNRCLEEKERAGDPIHDDALAAVQHFEQTILGTEKELPERWNSAALAAAVSSAQLQLRFLPNEPQQSKKILEAALREAPQADPDWRGQAQGLLIVLLVQDEQFDKASVTLREMTTFRPIDLDIVISELHQLISSKDRADQQQQLAALLLSTTTLQLGSSPGPTPAQRLRSSRIQAESLAKLGHQTEALESLAALAAEHPQDAPTQEAYALLLVESPDQTKVKSSLDLWRGIARRSRPKTERWYRSKYYLAKAHLRLGNRVRASEILRWVQSVPPGFAGTTRQDDFKKLLLMASPSDP